MPVNMDPSKKRRRPQTTTASATEDRRTGATSTAPRQSFGEQTEADRERDLAEAESQNLWDATEVIDMDKV